MDNLELHTDYGSICLVTNQIIQQLSKDWTFFGDLLSVKFKTMADKCMDIDHHQ